MFTKSYHRDGDKCGDSVYTGYNSTAAFVKISMDTVGLNIQNKTYQGDMQSSSFSDKIIDYFEIDNIVTVFSSFPDFLSNKSYSRRENRNR